MPDNSLSGKLVVILHADIVGSTILVQQDEQKSHARIQESFRRFEKTIVTYHGQVRELRGDALLAEFDRASDAVSATLVFQSEQADYNQQLEDNIRPLLRVGIALGEVVIADDTITGAGVVLAQRLEQLAEPGGLCITPAIREALPQRLPFSLKSLGTQQLKGFDQSIEVYQVALLPDTSVPPPEKHQIDHSSKMSLSRRIVFAAVLIGIITAAGVVIQRWQPEESIKSENQAIKSPDKPSIAVLPFFNMSGEEDQQYFADGISEDLTTDLSKISGLFVAARSASFAYRDDSLDLRDVSRELGVRYLLEGSLRRRGDQVRINAQLIDGDTGGHIWAERFDGAMSEIFELQDEVNKKIVEALEVTLTLSEKEQLDKVETMNSAAYDVLLQGLEQFHLSSPEAVRQARRLFKRATELDPNYARAYANIAMTYASEVNFAWAKNKNEAIQFGLGYIDKAMELDTDIPQIHFSRSALYLAQRNYEASIEAARRLIEIHPTYADGYGMLAFALAWAGEFQEALDAIQTMRSIDQQISYLDLALEARALFFMKRYDEAVEKIKASVERNANYDRSQLLLAAIYARLDRPEDAAWAVEEALAINPNITLEYERGEAHYKRQEDTEHYIEALQKAGVPEI